MGEQLLRGYKGPQSLAGFRIMMGNQDIMGVPLQASKQVVGTISRRLGWSVS